ncbi:MAG: SLBB domain-containing protein [Candidatus Delongbacteria bacterium]|nr:SLBB domain-containing protein [Candidatus Delongbacteria bacterium]
MFISLNPLSSQDGDFIQTEMFRIQEEFQTGSSVQDSETGMENSDLPIPQDELVKELMKPGNENLLEQIKQTGKIEVLEDIDKRLSEKQTEEQKLQEEMEKQTRDDKEKEEEERKLRSARATLDGLLFEDNYAYYQSIKDFYGYDIFLRVATKTQQSSILPNDDYVIGPGDEMVLTLWGDTELQRNLKVSDDGTIYLREVGVVSVHGYKLYDLRDRLRKILSQRYSTIDPSEGEPTTHYDLSLRKLKLINISVNGEVVVPGNYSVSSHSSALDVLKLAKGITARGTMREIFLLRNGNIHSKIDFYDYLLSGNTLISENLKDGDNIFVGPRLSTVEMRGEVLKPLKYELKSGETLKDLIKFSGGLLPTAAIDRISIERILPFEQRKGPVVTTKIFDWKYTELVNGVLQIIPIKLFTHDIVTVFQTPKLLTDFVSLGGAVYRKGRYSFENEMTIGNLLTKAGGLLSDAYTEKVELIRTNPNSRTEYKILNLKNGDMNFILNPKDSIFIHSEWGLKSRKVVVLSGYIEKPGFYFLHDSMKVSDLIFTKGGLEDEKHRNMTYMKRADLVRYNPDGLTTSIIPINLEKVMSGDKTEDILLEDRDYLRIYGIGVVFTEPSVKITGYVRYEGTYPMSEKMTVEDLVMKAHGFREGALKYKAVVFRLIKERDETDSLSQIIEVDIDSDFMDKGTVSLRNFFLKDKDHVVIRKHPDFEHIRTVTISGEVKFPGVYNLTHRHETFKEIIDRAGGLTSEAFLEGTVLQRDSIKFQSDFRKAITSKRAGIVMKHKDDIHIPKRPGKVEVKGFVYSPGTFTYREDWTLADYVEAAGGPVKDLEYMLGETIVYYPGGNAKLDGWWMAPDVAEGSTIVVEKVKRPEDSQWRAEIRQWLGIVTSTITILVLISRM